MQASISTKGAELNSLKDMETGKEYMWQAQPEVWPRHAPVLFPIVGRLIENQYKMEDEIYTLSQHGFARDSEFDVVKWNASEVELSLKPSEKTFEQYPFVFDFRLNYKLEGKQLFQTFKVTNHGGNAMPVSFGAHPAFIAEPVEQCWLQFEYAEIEESDTVENGIRRHEMRPAFNGNKIELSKTIFDRDALIFKQLKSKEVTLFQKETPLLKVRFPGFPFLGIWSKPAANFVCIEPWCGIADGQHHNQNIYEKEGIMLVQTNETIERQMVVEVL